MQFLQYNNIENKKMPQILGLTSTLIHPNTKCIKDELIELQQTFNATIKTSYEDDLDQ